MATLSSLVGGSSGGFTDGPRNTTAMWNSYGTYEWTVPTDFDNSVPERVYCWGAGGNAGTDDASGNSYGGGGGGFTFFFFFNDLSNRLARRDFFFVFF